MMGWVTFSLSERLRFPFCWYLLKGKHVRCLITVWHLTVFSDQSDVAFFIYIYIFMLAIWRKGNKEKKTVLSLSSSLSKASFQHSYQHQIPRVLCSFFPLLFVFIFSSRSFWTNPVCRDLIATIRAQEKSLSSVKKCQPPKGPAKSQLDRWKRLEDASHLKVLFHTTRSWTFTFALIAISQIQLAAHLPPPPIFLWGVVTISFFIDSEYVLL